MKDAAVSEITGEDLVRWQAIVAMEIAIKVNPGAFSAAETMRNQMEEIRFKAAIYVQHNIDRNAGIGISVYTGQIFILQE